MHNIYIVINTILTKNKGIDKLSFLFKGIIWVIRKRLKHSFKHRLFNGALIKVYPHSNYSSLFYFKYQEGTDLLFIRKNSFLSDTLVDVGSNVGMFCASLFDKFKNFVLIEPCKSSYSALIENIELNRNKDRFFYTYPIACSDSKKKVSFIEDGVFSATSRIPLYGEKPTEENSNIIDADSLDNIIGNRFQSIVLKIDVEGHEESVFNGATNLFSKQIPKLVMFERLGRTNLSNIHSFLKGYNYVVFRVMKNGNVSTNENDISEPLINLFACPQDIFSSLSK